LPHAHCTFCIFVPHTHAIGFRSFCTLCHLLHTTFSHVLHTHTVWFTRVCVLARFTLARIVCAPLTTRFCTFWLPHRARATLFVTLLPRGFAFTRITPLARTAFYTLFVTCTTRFFLCGLHIVCTRARLPSLHMGCALRLHARLRLRFCARFARIYVGFRVPHRCCRTRFAFCLPPTTHTFTTFAGFGTLPWFTVAVAHCTPGCISRLRTLRLPHLRTPSPYGSRTLHTHTTLALPSYTHTHTFLHTLCRSLGSARIPRVPHTTVCHAVHATAFPNARAHGSGFLRCYAWLLRSSAGLPTCVSAPGSRICPLAHYHCHGCLGLPHGYRTPHCARFPHHHLYRARVDAHLALLLLHTQFAYWQVLFCHSVATHIHFALHAYTRFGFTFYTLAHVWIFCLLPLDFGSVAAGLGCRYGLRSPYRLLHGLVALCTRINYAPLALTTVALALPRACTWVLRPTTITAHWRFPALTPLTAGLGYAFRTYRIARLRARTFHTRFPTFTSRRRWVARHGLPMVYACTTHVLYPLPTHCAGSQFCARLFTRFCCHAHAPFWFLRRLPVYAAAHSATRVHWFTRTHHALDAHRIYGFCAAHRSWSAGSRVAASLVYTLHRIVPHHGLPPHISPTTRFYGSVGSLCHTALHTRCARSTHALLRFTARDHHTTPRAFSPRLHGYTGLFTFAHVYTRFTLRTQTVYPRTRTTLQVCTAAHAPISCGSVNSDKSIWVTHAVAAFATFTAHVAFTTCVLLRVYAHAHHT